jgi:AcrR family transcriptional regulator
LLDAGRELFPGRGCAGLAVREVAEKAGVNLGMFHYHFKSRDAFLRALLQATYEEMFAKLTLEVSRPADTLSKLRFAMRALGGFGLANRRFLARIFADALTGEAIAREFLRKNLPRHIGVMAGLLAQGQREGVIIPVPVPQAIGMAAGSIAMPILVAGGMLDSGALEATTASILQAAVLSTDALHQRIELVLKALSQEQPAASKAAKPPRKTRGKS